MRHMEATTTRKRPVLQGLAVTADGNTFEVDSRSEGIEVLKFLSAPGVEDTFPCGWMIELTGDRIPYEVDFPSDLVGECRAPARAHGNGWECLNGHEHVSYLAWAE